MDESQQSSSLVFAFDPGHGANTPTVYRRDANSTENAYDVPDSNSKIGKAIDNLPQPMEEYGEPEGGAFWIRYEYASLIDDNRPAKRLYEPDR